MVPCWDWRSWLTSAMHLSVISAGFAIESFAIRSKTTVKTRCHHNYLIVVSKHNNLWVGLQTGFNPVLKSKSGWNPFGSLVSVTNYLWSKKACEAVFYTAFTFVALNDSTQIIGTLDLISELWVHIEHFCRSKQKSHIFHVDSCCYARHEHARIIATLATDFDELKRTNTLQRHHCNGIMVYRFKLAYLFYYCLCIKKYIMGTINFI